METLFGLPAHMFLIHAPIVLLPITAAITVALAVVPRWRHRFRWWMVGAVALVSLLVYLAKNSGDELDAAFDGAVDVSRHQDLGNTTLVLTLLWLVAIAGLAIYDRLAGDPAPSLRSSASATHSSGSADRPSFVGSQSSAAWALGAVSSVLAVLATVWLVRTGHEGTEVVWKTTSDTLFG